MAYPPPIPPSYGAPYHLGPPAPPVAPPAPPSAPSKKDTGFIFELSEGQAPKPVDLEDEGDSDITIKSVTGDQLAKLFDRVPAIAEKATDATEFKMREKSIKPPKTAQTVPKQFPPPEDMAPPPKKTTTQPLEVLRYFPDGATTKSFPQLQVTFNESMIFVGSVDEVNDPSLVPVKLTPQPEGKWRWTGTKTISFKPTYKFPQSTEYKAVIPAGVASTSGSKLAKEVSFTFSTPTVQFSSIWPSTHATLDTPIVLVFDQQVSFATLKPNINLKAGGNAIPFAEFTAAEIKEYANDYLNSFISGQVEGRWVVIRPKKDLPYDSIVTVVIKAGAKSNEGPVPTPYDLSQSFTTYGPFKIKDLPYSDPLPCSAVSIRFTNKVDEESFDPTQVTAEPPIPNLTCRVSGTSMTVQGRTKGKTTYKITLPSKCLRDEFDQTLANKQTFSFKVRSADMALLAEKSGMYVADPALPPYFVVITTNMSEFRLLVRQVEPEEFPESQPGGFYLNKDYGKSYTLEQHLGPAGAKKVVVDKTIKTEKLEDVPEFIKLDLAPYLQFPKEQLGQLYIGIEPIQSSWKKGSSDWNYRPIIYAWVQVTKLGLVAFGDNRTLQAEAWVTELVSGAPIQGAQLSNGSRGDKGVPTDENGIAQISFTDRLVVRNKNDVAFIRPAHGHSNTEQPMLICTFDDRKLYKPKETITIKGYARNRVDKDGSKFKELKLVGTSSITATLYDPRGQKIGDTQTAQVNPKFGSFDFKFKLPDNVNLGDARIDVCVNSTTVKHNFEIQEFRRPEYKATCGLTNGPYFRDSSATATVTAAYYSGGNLNNADVKWTVKSTPSSFTPPKRFDYTFGHRETPAPPPPFGSGSSLGTHDMQEIKFEGSLDTTGAHYLDIKWRGAEAPPRPVTLTVNTTVKDMTNQTVSASASLLVHPSKLYVGLRKLREYCKAGQGLPVEFVVCDIKGRMKRDIPIDIKVERVDHVYDAKSKQTKRTVVVPISMQVTSTKHALEQILTLEEGGEHKIIATVRDKDGFLNQCSTTLFVIGGKTVNSGKNDVESIQVITDKSSYLPGEVARVTVVSPFEGGGHGWYHLIANATFKSKRFTFRENNTYTFKVTVKEDFTPGIQVRVAAAGPMPRRDDSGENRSGGDIIARPARGTGSTTINVPPAGFRQLTVVAEPEEKELGPGGSTTVNVQVTLPDGKPADKAEVCLLVVDDAVLALTGYTLPSVLQKFYPAFSPSNDTTDIRDLVYIVDFKALADFLKDKLKDAPEPPRPIALPSPQSMRVYSSGPPGGPMPPPMMNFSSGPPLVQAGPPPMMAMSFSAPAPPPPAAGGAPPPPPPGAPSGAADVIPEMDSSPIAVRSNFDALALFAASVTTNAEGKATAKLTMPDSLSSFRVWAVAVHDTSFFGQSESSVTVQLPISIRPSLPRFFNFGDKANVSVVVSNQSNVNQLAMVGARATNMTVQADRAGVTVQLPPKKRALILFPVETAMCGTARFQFAIGGGSFADATEIKVPIFTPATTEAFATYGEIDGSNQIVQPVLPPGNVYHQFGNLEITTTSTAVASLTDAFIYLYHYDFSCTEQLSSRILSILSLDQVLQAFKIPGTPSPSQIDSRMKADLKTISTRQCSSGGFAYWSVYEEKDQPSVFMSLHAMHAIQRCQGRGYDYVATNIIEKGKSFLKNIRSYLPSYIWSRHCIATVVAQALYIRRRFKEDVKKEAISWYNSEKEYLSLEAQAWVLQAIHDVETKEAKDILLTFKNRVAETAETANFVTSYGDDGKKLLLHSNRRTDAVVLEALIDEAPQNDLIVKVVKGLQAGKKQGRWGNTQENCWILLALKRYFDVFEKDTPDFIARVWLDDDFAGATTYKGRSTDSHETKIPMSWLQEKQGLRDLIIDKDGDKGRLYYRIGLTYAPRDLFQKAADEGFEVVRTYESVDNPDDVKYDKESKKWVVKIGTRVRVRLAMTNVQVRYHVALMDKLPAGFEPLNPAIKIAEPIPHDPNSKEAQNAYWWRPSSWEHINMRDERVEAFASYVWPGTHEYVFVCRATTRGQYVAPPAYAEEMYSPELFGRSQSENIVVV